MQLGMSNQPKIIRRNARAYKIGALEYSLGKVTEEE
jgi:hypothetical protein